MRIGQYYGIKEREKGNINLEWMSLISVQVTQLKNPEEF